MLHNLPLNFIKPCIAAGLLVCVFLLNTVSAITDDKTSSAANIDAELEQLQDDSKVTIKINDHLLSIDYADEPMERQLGLMYRKQICDDCGMLFKFDSVRLASIWMKNTYIPLDLAYIDTNGIIVDIAALTPLDERSVTSSKPVLFALEMNQGWFGKKNIRVGDKVEQLPK